MREIKFRAWHYKKHEMRDVNSIWMYERPHVFVGEETWFEDYKLLQCIGLKENEYDDVDINKEIFEGDVIMFIDGSTAFVEWNDDICHWQFSNGNPINNGETYGIYKKIIGNIYEHPHLLNATV